MIRSVYSVHFAQFCKSPQCLVSTVLHACPLAQCRHAGQWTLLYGENWLRFHTWRLRFYCGESPTGKEWYIFENCLARAAGCSCLPSGVVWRLLLVRQLSQ